VNTDSTRRRSELARRDFSQPSSTAAADGGEHGVEGTDARESAGTKASGEVFEHPDGAKAGTETLATNALNERL